MREEPSARGDTPLNSVECCLGTGFQAWARSYEMMPSPAFNFSVTLAVACSVNVSLTATCCFPMLSGLEQTLCSSDVLLDKKHSAAASGLSSSEGSSLSSAFGF